MSTLVAHTALDSSNGNDVTTAALNTTGANYIALAYSNADSPAVTISDSKSNVWSPLTLRTGGTNVRIYYCVNPVVGSGHTFTVSGAGSFPSIAVQAWTVSGNAAFDVENGASDSVVTSKNTGSITPSALSNLVLAVMGGQTTIGTISIDSGFTISDQIDVASLGGAIAFAYKDGGLSATENPTFSWTTNTNVTTDIASFSVAAGASVKVGSMLAMWQ